MKKFLSSTSFILALSIICGPLFQGIALGADSSTLSLLTKDIKTKKIIQAPISLDGKLLGTGNVSKSVAPNKSYTVLFGELDCYKIKTPSKGVWKTPKLAPGKKYPKVAYYQSATCTGGNGGTNYADQFCKRIESLGCEGYDSCYHSASTYFTITKTEADCANNASDCSTANSCWSTAKPK